MFTDGAARGNPNGPGGYGVVLKEWSEDQKKVIRMEEFAGAFAVTSNSRMELLSAIVGLEAVTRPSEVYVYSDSKYLTDAFNAYWINNWKANGWISTATHKPVKNQDLWQRLLEAKKPHKTKFVWIKGHSGFIENERCDYLATAMADGKQLVKWEEDKKYHDINEVKPKKETDNSKPS
jgi:ribonuclease HI